MFIDMFVDISMFMYMFRDICMIHLHIHVNPYVYVYVDVNVHVPKVVALQHFEGSNQWVENRLRSHHPIMTEANTHFQLLKNNGLNVSVDKILQKVGLLTDSLEIRLAPVDGSTLQCTVQSVQMLFCNVISQSRYNFLVLPHLLAHILSLIYLIL
jgi:hypothetical protein